MPDTIHTKTIRYNLSPVHNPADINTLTATTIGTASIYIAENGPSTPVKFKSVQVWAVAQDICTATGLTLQSTGNNTFISASVGSSALTQIYRLPVGVTHSGENQTVMIGPMEAEPLFTANFGTGQSQQHRVVWKHDGITGTGTGMRAAYSWVDITYEYSSSAAKRMQTICIPLGGRLGALPTSLQTQFTVPQLSGSGGLLDGYGSLAIRNAYIEFNGNNGANNNSTDLVFSISFDGGAAITFPTREMALATNICETYIYPYAQTTTAAHTCQMSCGTSTRFHNTYALMWVTFEFNPATTTQILNNVRIPVTQASYISTTVDNRHIGGQVNIQEPGPITLRYAAMELTCNSISSPSFSIKWPGETSGTTFSFAGSLTAGQFPAMHTRSSALPGFSRGVNNISAIVSGTETTTNAVSGQIHILYNSSIPSGGLDLANRYVTSNLKTFGGFLETANARLSGSYKISEPRYEVSSFGALLNSWEVSAANDYTINTAALNDESSGSYFTFNSINSAKDGENQYALLWMNEISNRFKTYPEQVDSTQVLDPVRNRRYLLSFQNAIRPGAALYCNYHAITHIISGSISNSNGGGLTASLYKYPSGELHSKTYRTGDGPYTFYAYDDTIQYYVDVYETDTYKGRSAVDYPGTGFNVSLSSTGGEVSYTFAG